MSISRTERLLRISLIEQQSQTVIPSTRQQPSLSSQQMINKIYQFIYSAENEKPAPNFLYISQQTNSHSSARCSCKKSKCLKMYCECFARGSFCQDCSCSCCSNTETNYQARARARDQILNSSLNLVRRSSKGCFCKKTGCQKKYCQCYSSNVPCNEHCKCNNCSNC